MTQNTMPSLYILRKNPMCLWLDTKLNIDLEANTFGNIRSVDELDNHILDVAVTEYIDSFKRQLLEMEAEETDTFLNNIVRMYKPKETDEDLDPLTRVFGPQYLMVNDLVEFLDRPVEDFSVRIIVNMETFDHLFNHVDIMTKLEYQTHATPEQTEQIRAKLQQVFKDSPEDFDKYKDMPVVISKTPEEVKSIRKQYTEEKAQTMAKITRHKMEHRKTVKAAVRKLSLHERLRQWADYNGRLTVHVGTLHQEYLNDPTVLDGYFDFEIYLLEPMPKGAMKTLLLLDFVDLDASFVPHSERVLLDEEERDFLQESAFLFYSHPEFDSKIPLFYKREEEA